MDLRSIDFIVFVVYLIGVVQPAVHYLVGRLDCPYLELT